VGIHDGISRRRVLGMAVAVGRLWPCLVGGASVRVSPSVKRDTGSNLGAVYPVVKPLYQG